MSNPAALAIRGTLIHTPTRGCVQFIEDGIVLVDAEGRIGEVGPADRPELAAGFQAARTQRELHSGQYLLPGLVDLHIHAPQWPQLGKALDVPLNDWLQQYTFPLEAKYADIEFAQRSYESLVDNLLAHGTTTATYYGSIHVPATKLLADIAAARGQRALVGKVAMDNVDECPDYYRDASVAASLDGTRDVIDYVRNLGNDLVMPVVTPRFIPSCSDELLHGLGEIVNEYDCHVQTHCSESDWQHGYVKSRHGMNDTQSLDRFGLLTDKTILAHANLIEDGDMATIGTRQCGIAHCPLSNIYLSHAVFPVKRALDFGLTVGLGTDIAGGASPSILHNCQVAVSASRTLEDGVNPRLSADERGTADSRIDFREAFWMATVGGARALNILTGQFAEGYSFDAMLVDANVEGSDLMVWDTLDGSDDVLQKIVYNANRRNIAEVWVAGRSVCRND